ncbi:MAG: hypothetical protein C0600_01500 [Ignavibacteria bacterium]|nr:MAG: hypothetical protein C0600_01500 [Ignavibacteria bacterium]
MSNISFDNIRVAVNAGTRKRTGNIRKSTIRGIAFDRAVTYHPVTKPDRTYLHEADTLRRAGVAKAYSH